jgi:hypothetical protein
MSLSSARSRQRIVRPRYHITTNQNAPRLQALIRCNAQGMAALHRQFDFGAALVIPTRKYEDSCGSVEEDGPNLGGVTGGWGVRLGPCSRGAHKPTPRR